MNDKQTEPRKEEETPQSKYEKEVFRLKLIGDLHRPWSLDDFGAWDQYGGHGIKKP